MQSSAVAALFAEGKFGLRSKDMNVRVAGARRHCKDRTLRVAVGARARFQCAGLIRAHGLLTWLTLMDDMTTAV